jgi:hypothetical protein
MNSSTLDLIPNSPNLHYSICESQIIESIIKKIQSIPQYQKYGKSLDIILLICNSIENLVFECKLKKQKGFKKEIAHEIYERLGWSDKEFVSNAIDFLHSKDLIEKIKLWNKIKYYTINFFIKFLEK